MSAYSLEIEGLVAHRHKLQAENERLRAEVERLRAALQRTKDWHDSMKYSKISAPMAFPLELIEAALGEQAKE